MCTWDWPVAVLDDATLVPVTALVVFACIGVAVTAPAAGAGSGEGGVSSGLCEVVLSILLLAGRWWVEDSQQPSRGHVRGTGAVRGAR